jgi:serine/threonine protein kinase
MLAHYRVEAKLGEGGMGAVYRGHDTRLNRKVALKVLAPERFAYLERNVACFGRPAPHLPLTIQTLLPSTKLAWTGTSISSPWNTSRGRDSMN